MLKLGIVKFEEAIKMKRELSRVIAEAKAHRFVNGGEVYVIKNDKRIYYCDGKNASQFHYRDHCEGLHPMVVGYWSSVIRGFGNKFYSLIEKSAHACQQ